MTREEAIKVVRNIYQTDAEKEALETLIPELAESEDERIRKSLIKFLADIKEISESGRTTWAVREDDAEMCKSFLVWLEKRKDASKAIEAVERIDKYIDENLANAHDMKDSNPDKKYYRGWDDALGKMSGILQDVYSGGNEKEQKEETLRDFIDNFPYSAEQKEQDKCPEYCVRSHCIGCSIYENQKEDKSSIFPPGLGEVRWNPISSVQQKPILEVFGFKVGDAVRLKDGDGRKHIIKSFEEVEGLHGPNFYHVEFEDNSAVDGIYPGEEYPNGYYTQMEKLEEVQGPPQEEKQVSLTHEPPFDENPSDIEIIEALIHHLNEQDGFLTAINCVSTKAILSWLIKQKPAENHTLEFEKAKAKYEGIVEGKQTVLDNPEDYGLYKPAECSKATINGEPIPTENKSVDIPLAEWSEEDSDNLERVDNYLWMLDDYVGDDCAMPQGKTDKIRGNIQRILSPWLKSLPERLNLQPKPEWSEEDKEWLSEVYFAIDHSMYSEDERQAMKNYINSLRKDRKTKFDPKPGDKFWVRCKTDKSENLWFDKGDERPAHVIQGKDGIMYVVYIDKDGKGNCVSYQDKCKFLDTFEIIKKPW